MATLLEAPFAANLSLGPVHTGHGAPRNRHTQKMEQIVVNGSVHTACKNIKGFARKFVCKSACTSCVNGALSKQLSLETSLNLLLKHTVTGVENLVEY